MNFKSPKKRTDTQIKKFFKQKFKNKFLKEIFLFSVPKDLGINEKMVPRLTPYKPQIKDLYRLYEFIVRNKRLCVLEFGCGWSSLIINEALEHNKKNYGKNLEKIRQMNKFKHFSIDNDKYFIKKTKKKISKNNISKFLFSDCNIKLTNNILSHEYYNFPNINPDFIYIDGPDIFKIKGKINNISFNNCPERIPVASDLLKIEYQLLPGTIILFDGRTTNARFLKDHFKRNWVLKHDKANDQNILFLNEKPLGKHNLNQLKYYNFI
jgi:hypothetical protein